MRNPVKTAKRQLLRVGSCALSALMVLGSIPAAAIGDGVTATYDEAYYAMTDYYGNLTDGSVVKSYRTNGISTLTDYGDYDEVINLTDGTEPTRTDGKTVFQLDESNLPGTFYFEGKTAKPFEQLPWTLSVSYTLNGVPTKAEDLAGKKIGYSGTALSEAQIASMLKNVGLSADDCQFVDVGFDLLTATTTGQVDATTGNMVNHEVPQLEEEGFDINYFYPTDYGVPQSYELVFLAGKDAVDNNPEKIEKFLRACRKGFDFMKENPEEALQILLDHQNEENFPLSKTVETKSMEILLPVMETEDAKFLSQDVSVWQNNADWMYENGILKEKADVSFLVKNLLDE